MVCACVPQVPLVCVKINYKRRKKAAARAKGRRYSYAACTRKDCTPDAHAQRLISEIAGSPMFKTLDTRDAMHQASRALESTLRGEGRARPRFF